MPLTIEQLIEALKQVNREVSKAALLQYFNDNDIEYYNMTDLEMYIVYYQDVLKGRAKAKEDLCPTCKREPRTRYKHGCPYAAEIHGDNNMVCYCCDSCIQECANEV